MSSSQEGKDAPTILVADNYPSAPTMSSSTSQTISSPTLQYEIQQQQEGEGNGLFTTTISSKNNQIIYYYQDTPLQQQHDDTIPLFYNCHKKPIWKLASRDWHGMTLFYQHFIIILSTTPPQFRFTFKERFYHWQVVKGDETITPYKLQCYETETKKLIAQLDGYILLLDIPIVKKEGEGAANEEMVKTDTNPFRKSSNINLENNEDDPFTTFVILSGLLVNNHIKSLLKSLGGGPEALHIIIDPPAAMSGQHQHSKSADVFNHMYNNENHAFNGGGGEDDDDIASLSSTYPRHYSGHQSLVDGGAGAGGGGGIGGNRWSSSAQSFKSIELDPGVWHCWWGYKFWWSWFPCCMPGGCCDRACIRLKGHKPKVRTNTRTLSKQGWKQQHY